AAILEATVAVLIGRPQALHHPSKVTNSITASFRMAPPSLAAGPVPASHPYTNEPMPDRHRPQKTPGRRPNRRSGHMGSGDLTFRDLPLLLANARRAARSAPVGHKEPAIDRQHGIGRAVERRAWLRPDSHSS